MRREAETSQAHKSGDKKAKTETRQAPTNQEIRKQKQRQAKHSVGNQEIRKQKRDTPSYTNQEIRKQRSFNKRQN